MTRFLILTVMLVSLLFSCLKKEALQVPEPDFITYTIPKNQHYSTNSTYKPISNLSAQVFLVWFDTSARYSTVNPNNQSDINKLYGFSDNNSTHHAFSARIGWRWLNNKLELLGYVYNDSIMSYRLIGDYPINSELRCEIQVKNSQYLFSVNGNSISLPRTSSTPSAIGYQLYPYFGGDETAPHDIKIKIKEL